MDKKICSCCGELLFISEFYNDVGNQCKKCRYIKQQNRRRTKKGIALSIYNQQKYCCRYRNYNIPKYSKDDLYKWLISQDDFISIYDKWVYSGYKKDLKPSVDRIDDYKTYTLDNIQLTTWKKNMLRAHEDAKNGINNKKSTPVIKLDKNGKVIYKFYSIKQANRECLCVSKTGLNNALKTKKLYKNSLWIKGEI